MGILGSKVAFFLIGPFLHGMASAEMFGLRFRVQGFGLGCPPPNMENQMEEKLDIEMESGGSCLRGNASRIRGPSK